MERWQPKSDACNIFINQFIIHLLAYVVLALLSCTYHFRGAHNLYQDKLAKIDMGVRLCGVGHMSDMAVLARQKSCITTFRALGHHMRFVSTRSCLSSRNFAQPSACLLLTVVS